ncbi:MAG: membrane integrity-associated transporter subunit PqiC [Comamonadaceae bacterium]|nr:MAG: membrane integrity-associated transporter subunit PqiC [Comamonadaceae bacterium]
MNRVALAAMISGVLALAGCASAPVQYYTLTAPAQPATGAQAPAAGREPLLIEVLPVGMPEMLDRVQMVVRQGDAGIAVLDGQRWASPLSDELRAALAAELSQQWGASDVSGLPRKAGAPLWRIKVEVRRVDAWPGRQLQLDSDWSASLTSDASRRLSCTSRISLQAPADYGGLAATHQTAVRHLAQQIGHALQSQAC